MKLVFILLIFIIIGFPASLFAQESNTLINVDQLKKRNITPNLKVYTAGNKSIDASLAFLYYTAGKFQPVQRTNSEFINDGLISSEKWFALNIENTTNEEMTTVLEFILSGINTSECYMVNDVQQINYVLSPQVSNKESRQSVLSKSVTYNIPVLSQEKVLLLIHTVNKGQLLYIPAYIYSLGYVRETDIYRNNFFGIFQGIFVFIIIFNLLIYLSTWDKIYLFYMLYAFAIAIFAMNDVGAAPSSFFPLNLLSGQTFLFCGFCAWLLLMERFIMLTKKNFISYKLLRLLAITDLAYAFLPYTFKLLAADQNVAVQSFYQAGLNILFAINLLFIIITNISRVSNRNKLAIFYAAANIPVLLGTLIYYTNYYKITNIQLGWLNPIALGLSIETFILSFGFAYRFNLIGKEKRELFWRINKQQEEVTQQLVEVQETERKRIAEDLHDELGSNLAALKINLQAGYISDILPNDRYKQMVDIIDKASDDLRRIAHNLMPPEFGETKLSDLLSTHISRLNRENKLTFQFIISGSDNHFDKQQELFIYRVILELTNNIIRHAAATEANIQLLYYDDHLEIMAEDNGIGFSKINSDGIGLNSIKSRISYLQGNLNIDSNKFGTTVLINIPYPPEKDATNQNNHSR